MVGEERSDCYGTYTPSPPAPPIPSLPCQLDKECAQGIKSCPVHSNVLFIRLVKLPRDDVSWQALPDHVSIPYGRWEDWEWYYDRVAEALQIDVDDFCLLYAGCKRMRGDKRHSGLQVQSTVHCLANKSTLPSNEDEDDNNDDNNDDDNDVL